MRLAAVLLGIGLFFGVGEPAFSSGPQAPLRSGEEAQIVGRFRQISQMRDMSLIGGILPTDPEIRYASAWWFTRHAGECGLPSSPGLVRHFRLEELVSLGYLGPISRRVLLEALSKGGELKGELAALSPERLDLLPTDQGTPHYRMISERYCEATLGAGLYRLVTGLGPEIWARMEPLGPFTVDRMNAKVTHLTLGIPGIVDPQGRMAELVTLGFYESFEHGPLGISYFHYRRYPERIASLVADLEKTRN